MNNLYNEKNYLSRKLKSFVLDYNELKSTVGGAIDQVCSGEKVIFLMDDWGVRTSMPSNCELVAFDQEHLVNMAFTFMKNSPYSSLFNYYLQKFRDYGILHVLRTRESVNLITSIPIFLILLFGILLSLLILICEKIHFHIYSMYTIRHHEFSKSKTNYWKPLIR
ncbi:PREDICTED: uncharacterized protein LOC105364581 [Ceratosolen solmsi marchali]|uniref:Uncharacterized protein LOC105364581 n=1 Tax=Ceratosolen solmsi marchali TaxID=326594 RepID=A0AAJ7DYA7_9HYME|nr:PREDICTED: uncharacterized protein LOC105364581 [Ceratosolen solmsi marchali]